MKNVNSFIIIIIFCFILFANISCNNCKGEDPRAKVINNGTNYVSVQIKSFDNRIVNIDNIASGASSTYHSFPAGLSVCTIKLRTIEFIKTISVRQCYDYDIIIDSSNNVTTMATDRNL